MNHTPSQIFKSILEKLNQKIKLAKNADEYKRLRLFVGENIKKSLNGTSDHCIFDNFVIHLFNKDHPDMSVLLDKSKNIDCMKTDILLEYYDVIVKNEHRNHMDTNVSQIYLHILLIPCFFYLKTKYSNILLTAEFNKIPESHGVSTWDWNVDYGHFSNKFINSEELVSIIQDLSQFTSKNNMPKW